MTDPNSTFIAVVLDKSGSMEGVCTDTIGSFNTFLAEQQALPGDADFSLVLFNNETHVLYDGVPIKDVQPLNTTSYRPDGNTALLDALGQTIDRTGAKLAALPEAKRPAKVIVMVLTDGHENSSRRYTIERIRDMVTVQTSQYAWQFVFLGADLTAIDTAQAMGIPAAGAMAYTSSPVGVKTVMRSLSANMASYRGGEVGATVSFSALDRAENAPDK